MSKEPSDSNSAQRVEVKIFNKTYVLRSKGGEERIAEAARVVDERMRQISSQITTHDVVKIAVLAALNLADEQRDLKDYYEEEFRRMFAQTAPGDIASSESEAEGQSGDERPQSWFDDFFDASVPTKERHERLSSKVSAKLQSIRPANQESISIEAEDE